MKESMSILIVVALFIFSMLDAAPGKDSLPPNKTRELLAQGKKLYEENCSPCHGPKGDGKGPAGTAVKPPPSDFANPLKDWPNTKGDLNKMFQVISKGIPNSAMVKWDQLPEKDRWALAYTVMEFSVSLKQPTKKK
jgi:mono/diheme cytochrome c family protein